MNFRPPVREYPRNGVPVHPDGQGCRLVREAFDVAEDEGGADLRRQEIERRLDVVPAECLRGTTERQPSPSPVAASGRRPVEEQPRGDATQRVRCYSHPVSGADREDAQEDVSGETLGGAFAPGKPVGDPVHPRCVTPYDVLPIAHGNRLRFDHHRLPPIPIIAERISGVQNRWSRAGVAPVLSRALAWRWPALDVVT
jgi:hypothetical protein